jgi:hypothetical protein
MSLIQPKGQERDYRIPFQALAVNVVGTVTKDNVSLGFETSLNVRPHTEDIDIIAATDLLKQKLQSVIDNCVGRISLAEFLAKPDFLGNSFYHAVDATGMKI